MDWVPESTTEEGIDHAAEAIVVRLMGPTARLSLAALTAFIAAWTIATGAQTPAAESLAITNVTVIDVLASTASAARRLDQTVVVSNGRIASVGSAVTIRLPPGAVVVDGRGGYLIPGLWDAHTHIGPAGPSALPAYVANGVTTIRDLGGPVADIRTLERADQIGGDRRTADHRCGPHDGIGGVGGWRREPAASGTRRVFAPSSSTDACYQLRI